jgi:hypothetical protein
MPHHRHGLLEISRAVDTPAAEDHPCGHGDLHLVSLILGSTISDPATSAAWPLSSMPSPVLPVVRSPHPRAYAASQARLPGSWWCRDATPRARASPVRQAYLWSHRQRRCVSPAALGPCRRRPLVWCAHSQIERPVSLWEGQRGRAWWRWPRRTRRDQGGFPRALAPWWVVVHPKRRRCGVYLP